MTKSKKTFSNNIFPAKKCEFLRKEKNIFVYIQIINVEQLLVKVRLQKTERVEKNVIQTFSITFTRILSIKKIKDSTYNQIHFIKVR